MKNPASLLLTTLLFLPAACVEDHRPETGREKRTALELTVQAVQTKAYISTTTFPDGSQIGVFLTDREGLTYEGSTDNMRYTAAGTGASQKWSSETPAFLGSVQAQFLAYYPYSPSVTDITAVPVETASQTDYMWARPCRWLNYALYNAEVTMEHALSRVKIEFVKDASYTREGTVTQASITTENLSTGAILNATDGSLSSFTGQGEETELQKGSSPSEWSLMMIPTEAEGVTAIKATVDGVEYETAVNASYTQGCITNITVTVKGTELTVVNTGIIPWTDMNLGAGETDGAYRPKLTITGNTDNIIHKTSYEDGTYTVKAAALNGTVNEVSLVSGTATMEQSIDGNGVRTITLTDIQSDITLSFSGTSYLEWARIQHMDGTLYTAEEWLAAEAAGTVTDADANGVAVKYSKWTSCPHVIHPNYSASTMTWSSNTSVEVSGVYTTTISTTSDRTSCNHDVAGKANTDAILAAVTAGTIADAPAAQWASQVVFADGSQGYLPAAGEVCAWADNKTAINACMDAIGGDQVGVSTWNNTWTSTQCSSPRAWGWSYNSSYVNTTNLKYTHYNDRAVCAFAYDQANEYANK